MKNINLIACILFCNFLQKGKKVKKKNPETFFQWFSNTVIFKKTWCTFRWFSPHCWNVRCATSWLKDKDFVCVYVKVYVGGDKKRGEAAASSCRRNGSPWLLPSLVTKRYDLWPALPWEHQLKSAPHILGAPLETSATSSSRRRSGSRRSSSWVAWETIQFVSLALWVWSSRSSLNS